MEESNTDKISDSLKSWPILNLLDPDIISKMRMTFVYELGALVVTTDDNVYQIGENHFKATIIDALCGMRIRTFVYQNASSIMALTMEGQVYFWGHDTYKVLGIEKNNISIHTPVQLKPLDSVEFVDIDQGHNTCLLLAKNGKVYECTKEDYTPTEVPIYSNCTSDKKSLVECHINHICCGYLHNLVITNEGKVYSWGHNNYGQLGIEFDDEFIESPEQVLYPHSVQIEKIACGHMHTISLTTDGDLYVWGSDEHGQLGLGKKISAYSPTLLQVPEMGRVSDIAASNRSNISAAATTDGRIFVWGQCLGDSIVTPMLTQLKCLHDVFAHFTPQRIMHRPLFFRANMDVILRNDFQNAFDDPDTSDLIFKVQGKPIHVHRAILQMRSSYFSAMLQHGFIESSRSVIEHDIFSYEAYRAFLQYLYTNKIEVSVTVALELFELADAYVEHQLKGPLIRQMKRNITVTNAALLFGFAMEHDIADLYKDCLNFAFKNMTAVVESANFTDLSETAVKKFILLAARAGVFKT